MDYIHVIRMSENYFSLINDFDWTSENKTLEIKFSLINGEIHGMDLIIPLSHKLGWLGFDGIGMPFINLFEDRIVMFEPPFSLSK
jgi:hypothetical protein